MGRVREAPPHARAGVPLFAAQESIWDSVYARVWAFLLEVRNIDGGAKLTKAELDVGELEKLITTEMAQRNSYCDADGIRGAFLAGEADRIAPLIAEHVALPSRGGFFDPCDYLMDVAVRESYEDPDTLLVGGDASGEPASYEVPRGSGLSTSELLKLCKLLDDAGILALVSAEDAEDISQIFAQRKKFDPERAAWILRLLFDRRRRNERERHLHAASRDMPHAACFLNIILDDFEHIEFDTSDLECFYYTFLVSMKRALRNVFGRPLRASLFADFACYRPELAGRMVVPALASLAMGDRNACDYAQASNRELLIRAGALDPTCEVHYGRPIPRSRTLHGVLIDDRLSLSIIAGGAEGQGTAARATQEWDAAMDEYACSCGRPVEAKAQRRARKGRVWGARLDGRRGKLGGPPER